MATNIRRMQYAMLLGAFTPAELQVLAHPRGAPHLSGLTAPRQDLLQRAMSLSDEPIRDVQTFSALAATAAADCLRHNPNGAAFPNDALCKFAFDKTVRHFRGKP